MNNEKIYIMDIKSKRYKKLEKGKFYIVPGIDVKIARLGAKILPANIISKFHLPK